MYVIIGMQLKSQAGAVMFPVQEGRGDFLLVLDYLPSSRGIQGQVEICGWGK